MSEISIATRYIRFYFEQEWNLNPQHLILLENAHDGAFFFNKCLCIRQNNLTSRIEMLSKLCEVTHSAQRFQL